MWLTTQNIVLFLHSNFQQYFHPGYGNCFAFNKFDNKDDSEAGERNVSLPGPKFGLTLVLNVESQSYLEPITVMVTFSKIFLRCISLIIFPLIILLPMIISMVFNFYVHFKEGARIAIYSPTSYDNVDGNGIDLPTKTLTSLALERVNFEKPYCCVLYKRVIFNTNSMFNIILMKFHTI